MQVKEIMHKDPICCTPDTTLNEVARIMVDCDCGAVPVVEDAKTCSPLIGIVTDRDIVCRILAENRNPISTPVRECMSTPVASLAPDDSVENAVSLMEKNQIRRVPVVDRDGRCCGIVTQARIAKKLPEMKTGKVLKSISQPNEEPARVDSGAR